MKKSLLLAVCLLSAIPPTVYAGDKKPPKPATDKQDSYMQGRIFSGIEDSGCCLDEALRKLEFANDDINKLEYPPHTRWMARYWYAKVLLKKRDRKKAAKFVLLAQQDAQSLGTREQKDTQELAEEIQAKGK